MLTVNVALKSGTMSAATIATVESLVEEISSYYPTSPHTLEAACWADDLKSSAATQEANWHFIDLPVIGSPWSGTLPPLPFTDTNPWAINLAQSTTYSTKSTKLDKSRQVRFILHLVGDIHQPLHAAALYSDQFPNGDAGGNLYPIVLPGTDQYTNELHAVWDSGAGLWVDDLVRPLNATGTAWLDDMASKIMTAYPLDDPTIAPLIKQYNTSTWANESNAIAADFVYTAPQAPTVIPQAYIDTAQATCMRQIAIGGYRLAELLEYIFTSTEWGKDAIQQIAEGKKKKEDGGKKKGEEEELTREELDRPALRARRHHQ